MTQCDEVIRRHLKKPIVFVMCGIPGSGKSYYAKNTLMNNIWRHRVYISSDDIREEIDRCTLPVGIDFETAGIV